MAENQSDANGSLKTYDEHVPDIKFTKLFINGEFVDSVKGRIHHLPVKFLGCLDEDSLHRWGRRVLFLLAYPSSRKEKEREK